MKNQNLVIFDWAQNNNIKLKVLKKKITKFYPRSKRKFSFVPTKNFYTFLFAI